MLNASLSAPALHGVCSTYDSDDLCLPCGLARLESDELLGLNIARRRVRRHQALYLQGDAFEGLYAVRAGTFKSVLATTEGVEQVTGFQLAGEFLGLDGLAGGVHATSAFALEDAEVLVLPQAAEGGRDVLDGVVSRLLSRQIVCERRLRMTLTRRSAEQRLAAFLLDLSRRLGARGWSEREFNLRMTRAEIGSFLGMNLETVSRTFTRLEQQRLIGIEGRHVRLLDPAALAVTGEHAAHA